MMVYWVLDEQRRPVSTDALSWAKWFENLTSRSIAKTTVMGFEVSTVFLGCDHRLGEGPPILWETRVFGEGSSDLDMERCSGTWEQAEEMHRRMCDRVRETMGVT